MLLGRPMVSGLFLLTGIYHGEIHQRISSLSLPVPFDDVVAESYKGFLLHRVREGIQMRDGFFNIVSGCVHGVF